MKCVRLPEQAKEAQHSWPSETDIQGNIGQGYWQIQTRESSVLSVYAILRFLFIR